MNPETKIEIQLFDWLTIHGCEVYFNRIIKNDNNIIVFENKFTTIGSQEKCDLLFKPYNEKYYYGIEVKDASDSKYIRDGLKIIYYTHEYNEKKIKYLINNEEVKIRAFLLASQFSFQGKLFDEKEICLPKKDKNNQIWVKGGKEPPIEFTRTKELTRNMWGFWRPFRKKEEQAGAGVLLSDILDKPDMCYNEQTQCKPKMLVMIYEKRWDVQWIQI